MERDKHECTRQAPIGENFKVIPTPLIERVGDCEVGSECSGECCCSDRLYRREVLKEAYREGEYHYVQQEQRLHEFVGWCEPAEPWAIPKPPQDNSKVTAE